MTDITGASDLDDMLVQDSYGTGPSDAQVVQLRELAVEMEKLEDFIKKCEKLGKEAKERLKRLSEETLPNKMTELGVPGIDISGSRRVEIQPIVAAKMPKKEEPELYGRSVDWLNRHDLGDIVKREVVASVGKDSEEETKRIIAEITRITNGQVAVFERTDVNYQTLNATLKEQNRKGLPLPTAEDGFDIYVGPRAKLIRAK